MTSLVKVLKIKKKVKNKVEEVWKDIERLGRFVSNKQFR
jgi:hypothetical protein